MGTLSYQITDVPQLILAGAPLVPNTVAANLGYTLVNNDEVNQLWISSNQSFSPSDPTAVPVAPLGSVPIDPSTSTYAVTESGVTVQAFLFAGGGTWAPSPAQIAAQINALGLAQQSTLENVELSAAFQVGYLSGTDPGALIGLPNSTIAQEVAAWLAGGSVGSTPGGMPLLHGYNELLTNGYFDSAADSTQTFVNKQAMSNPGYAVQFTVGANGSMTVPFLTVNMIWTDNDGNTIAQERWVLTGDYTTSTSVVGKGPVKGPYLTVTLTNHDPTYAIPGFMTLFESTHHIARDDWRQITNPNSVPEYTTVGIADPLALTLGGAAGQSFASGTTALLLPLYAGGVWVSCVAGATDCFLLIRPVDPNISNQLTIYSISIPNSSPWQQELVTLPRCPCQLIIVNDNAGAEDIWFSVIAQEYAS